MKAWKINLLLIAVLTLVVNDSTVVAQEELDIAAIRADFAKAMDVHDMDRIVSLLADDFVWDYPALPTPIVGPDQFAGILDVEFTVSPDWHTDEGLVWVNGDAVIVSHAGHGIQTASRPEFPDIPPTNNPWVWPHVDIYEFEGDKIKRLTTYADHAGVFIQMGALPAPIMPDLTPSIDLPVVEPTGLSPLEANAEYIARWNSHDPALVAKMYHQEASFFFAPLGVPVGRSETTAMNEMYFQGFSDTRIDPVRIMDLGDGWVLLELVCRGTHDGPFMGVPASGYPMEIRTGWLTHYDEDGLVTQQSIYYDNLTLMTQMTEPPYSPVGTWIVSVPTPERNIILLHSIYPQDAAGNTAGSTMIQVNANPTVFGLLPDVEAETPWVGQTVRIDRNTFETSFITYGTKQGDGILPEIATMIMCNANWTITGPTTNVGRSTLSVYLADQDTNGDGLPDPDQEPTICLGFTFTSNRLPSVPACVVPPMPEPGQ
jgi:steroid delta-isomerase-like uncharacterized protein